MERGDQSDTLQREFRDVFEMFTYFVEVGHEIYLANQVEVDTSGAHAVVRLQDAWIWDERRPHRLVSRAEVRTDSAVRVEEIAHPSRPDASGQNGDSAKTLNVDYLIRRLQGDLPSD